jgi:alkylation response protein AidB-like acyl-CoA dehydrogenase
MADGTLGDVCEEFFDDVLLPAEHLIGEEHDGWSVAQTLLFHERNQTAGIGYGYLGGDDHRVGVTDRSAGTDDLLALARGHDQFELHAQAIADSWVDGLVSRLTSERIMRGMALGTHQGPWGSLGKLQGSEAGHRVAAARLAVHGADGVVWDGDDVELGNAGTAWLSARIGTIGGGTSEIQRNIVGERLLGLPREPSFDRDVPFNEVLRNATSF